MIKQYFIILLFLCFYQASTFGQAKPSQSELKDLTQHAINQVKIFQNNTSTIALAENSMATRKAAIRTTLRNFSEEATIEEQGKYSSRKTKRTAKDYLETLLLRGRKSPIVIDFDIVQELDIEGLVEIDNGDGTVSYKGKIVFNQFYCKLKRPEILTEPTKKNPNINCYYHDNTTKEVGVEILRLKGRGGHIWITLITYISVLKVE
jgi:hypothetical protein